MRCQRGVAQIAFLISCFGSSCVKTIPSCPTRPRLSEAPQAIAIAAEATGDSINYGGQQFSLDAKELEAVRFTNLSHPDISSYWARKKTDHEWSQNLIRGLDLNWFPLKRDGDGSTRLPKQTVCGRFRYYYWYNDAEASLERDWNLVVEPFAKYAFVVDEAQGEERLRRTVIPWLKWDPLEFHLAYDEAYWHPTLPRVPTCSEKPRRKCYLEVEVTPPRSLESPSYIFPAGPGVVSERFDELLPEKFRSDSVCAYGPWVQEAVHGFRPEIHPAEAIWWQLKEGGEIHLLSLQDASHRFDAYDGSGWKTPERLDPLACGEFWVQPQLVGEFLLLLRGARAASTSFTLSEAKSDHINTARRKVSPILRTADGKGFLQLNVLDAPAEVVFVAGVTTETEIIGLVSIRFELRGKADDEGLVNDGSFVEFVVGRTDAETK